MRFDLENASRLEARAHDLFSGGSDRAGCILDYEGFETFAGCRHSCRSDTVIESESDTIHVGHAILMQYFRKLGILASITKRAV